MAEGNITFTEPYDLTSILSTEERDFLVRNNGDQVKVKDLIGKNVGLYFSGSWCPPCQMFTPVLAEVYQQISSSRGDLEVIFISSDRNEDSFNGYFSKMPWLAVPFNDALTINRLKELFKVRGIPRLVIIDGTGNVSTTEGVSLVRDYEGDAYPFTPDRVRELKEQEEDARRNQTLSSILVSSTRDYVISKDEKKIPVSQLEGKMVGLYFSAVSYPPCLDFTQKLLAVYEELKGRGENFEIVLISLDDDEEEEQFKEGIANMPWFALPHKDKTCEKLFKYFELRNIPRLIIIGPDGKTLNPDVAELVEEHGSDAYPFTPEKLAELAEIEKARAESQTLESLLISGKKDYVIDKSGSKLPVSELVGKHILLYFSAHWCPPCRGFTPKLIEVYHEIKAKENAFEVIFISSDRDQDSFDDYYSSMPWLALPFGDDRKSSLSRKFKIQGIPSLVALGPSGRTVSADARGLVAEYGANAFPFTDEHILRLKDEKAAKGNEKMEAKEGYICVGDVCHKA